MWFTTWATTEIDWYEDLSFLLLINCHFQMLWLAFEFPPCLNCLFFFTGVWSSSIFSDDFDGFQSSESWAKANKELLLSTARAAEEAFLGSEKKKVTARNKVGRDKCATWSAKCLFFVLFVWCLDGVRFLLSSWKVKIELFSIELWSNQLLPAKAGRVSKELCWIFDSSGATGGFGVCFVSAVVPCKSQVWVLPASH